MCAGVSVCVYDLGSGMCGEGVCVCVLVRLHV